MKVEVNETPVEQKSKYPWIGKYKDGSFIMLFTEPEYGVVLQSVDKDWKVGERSDDMDESFFTPFTGSITLSND